MITQAQILGKDESQLVKLANGFLILPKVAEAFNALQQAAKVDSIDIQIASSYRSFDRQKRIWENKWSGKTQLLDANENPIDASTLTDWQKIQAILTWSALPGASRHHWGTDLDVYDKTKIDESGSPLHLVCSEYDENGPCFELSQWLAKYAADFGFIRPYSVYKGGIAREPWHLSYKDLSEPIIKQLSPEMLLATLKQSQVLGLAALVKNMPEIYSRFVLNQGKP
ncbi:M15 family metallopeptidase [uncultured Paraglaciecola sp.]|uniref:M15 family metallopeptidase n=1 Tax=uncultured Paraglaciecola sp. TaxID=1765024 RepID=UPI002596D801|nr:M15 family metallopeptidase [uncultured Paraglaciecola sp.]